MSEECTPSWFGCRKFNDWLALLLLVGIIPGLWVSSHWLHYPGEIIGASIMAWTIVLQYFYRKGKGEAK